MKLFGFVFGANGARSGASDAVAEQGKAGVGAFIASGKKRLCSLYNGVSGALSDLKSHCSFSECKSIVLRTVSELANSGSVGEEIVDHYAKDIDSAALEEATKEALNEAVDDANDLTEEDLVEFREKLTEEMVSEDLDDESDYSDALSPEELAADLQKTVADVTGEKTLPEMKRTDSGYESQEDARVVDEKKLLVKKPRKKKQSRTNKYCGVDTAGQQKRSENKQSPLAGCFPLLDGVAALNRQYK